MRVKGIGSVEGEGGDESEDTLHATIEKSKKVLAMQRNLLHQVLAVIVITFVCHWTFLSLFLLKMKSCSTVQVHLLEKNGNFAYGANWCWEFSVLETLHETY